MTNVKVFRWFLQNTDTFWDETCSDFYDKFHENWTTMFYLPFLSLKFN